MTKEQIETWITNHLNENPDIAKEYKEILLERLQAELTWNRKMGEIIPSCMQSAKELYEEIKRIETSDEKQLLKDKFVEEYHDTSSLESMAAFLETLTDEDHYVEGVFKDTKYHTFLRCEDDYINFITKQDKKKTAEARKIYQSGLRKKSQFIQEGEVSHQKLIEDTQNKIDQREDIDKTGPNTLKIIIKCQTELRNQYTRDVAQFSVTDAFEQMGIRLEAKNIEEIEGITTAHDPSVVEAAIKRLAENPTLSMTRLSRAANNVPVQSRKELKMMKLADISELIVGSICAALGIVGFVDGNTTSASLLSLIGVANLALGGSGLLRHMRKTDAIKEKDNLMKQFFNDIDDEIKYQEKVDAINSEVIK